MIWFIQSTKPNPSRLDEIKLLGSLPIPTKQIFYQFLYSDYLRFSWFLTFLIITYLALLPYSSLPFLSRPILFLTVFYFFSTTLGLFLNLVVSSLSQNNKSDGLIKYHPFIQVVILVFYIGIFLLSVLIPTKTSGLIFWAIVLSQFGLMLVLVSFSVRIFIKLHYDNNWFKSFSNVKKQQVSNQLSKFMILRVNRARRNPLLVKNLIQGWQTSSQISNSILVGGLITVTYFLAMNNEDITDRIAVLFGVTILFLIFFSIKTMQRLDPEIESTKIIFTLPISRFQQYISVLLPALLWSNIIVIALMFLFIVSGSDIQQASLFFGQAVMAAFILVSASVNFSMASYPDIKAAYKKFAYWIISLLIMIAIFYKYRVGVVLFFSLLSFISLIRMNHFRLSETLSEQSFV